MKYLLLVLAFASSCKRISTSRIQSQVAEPERGHVISWLCSGKGKVDPKHGGLSYQDEYCEWERKSVQDPQQLQCTFWSTFDQTRERFLTQRRDDPAFADTRFNSLSYLTGDFDPANPKDRTGIIPHCLKRKCGEGDERDPKDTGNCVPLVRASDPTVCQDLNALVAGGCKVQVEESAHVSARIPASNELGDPAKKVRLIIPYTLRDACVFKRDPSLPSFTVDDKTRVECDFSKTNHIFQNCDEVAKLMQVGVRVLVSQCSGI